MSITDVDGMELSDPAVEDGDAAAAQPSEELQTVPSWKPGIIPLEIPELKQKTLILPETFDTPTLTQRWHRGLLRLPFRPIRIGQEPRLPNDPETGVGLVLRLPVSF